MVTLLLITAYVFGAGLLYIAYIIFYQYTYWKKRKILHIELVPLLGNNAPIFFRTVSIPIHAQTLYKRHPGALYYGAFDFRRPTVILKDTELIREVCVKSFDYFTDHDTFVTEEMDPIVGRNIFSLKGQRWKDVRGALSPSYTASRMKLLFELIAECSNEFVQYFVEHPEVAKSFESKKMFTRYTNDVIATAAFGVKVNSMRNQDNEFFMHGKTATSFTSLTWILKLVLMQNFPRLMRLAGATFLPKSSDRFFKNLIKETVQLREEKGIIRPDMIQMMIQGMKKDAGSKVTMDDVLGQALIFFLAGFETSASLMSFIVHELAANLDVQEKLHREIDKQFAKDNSEFTYESLSEMKYLDMVVSETLRMYPPAPITNRVCVKDFKFPPLMAGYPEYHMKKGTIIMIPIFGLHRNPKYFPEPEKFVPERFSEEGKAKIIPYTYMPFGLGPRQCIGNRFALMETKIVIVHILRKFAVKFTDKTQYPVKFEKRGFNLGAEGGLWVQFEERKKIN